MWRGAERDAPEDERHRRDVDGAERHLHGAGPAQAARRPGEEELSQTPMPASRATVTRSDVVFPCVKFSR